MRRIRLVVAVAAMMVAMLSFSVPAMAHVDLDDLDEDGVIVYNISDIDDFDGFDDDDDFDDDDFDDIDIDIDDIDGDDPVNLID